MERRIWLKWAVGQEVADKIYDNIARSEHTSERQRYFISGSFTWSDTEEGYDYWCNINSKIHEYLTNKINLQLTAFLREKDLWGRFVDNFNPPCEQDSYDLGVAFLWTTSIEGHDFWSKVSDEYIDYRANHNYYNYYHPQDDKLSSLINSSLTNKSDYENQLQGKEDPRREGDGSERSGICCEGDESGFRLSYTKHRKRIDFQKREVRDFKVNLSTRYSIML